MRIAVAVALVLLACSGLTDADRAGVSPEEVKLAATCRYTAEDEAAGERLYYCGRVEENRARWCIASATRVACEDVAVRPAGPPPLALFRMPS